MPVGQAKPGAVQPKHLWAMAILALVLALTGWWYARQARLQAQALKARIALVQTQAQAAADSAVKARQTTQNAIQGLGDFTAHLPLHLPTTATVGAQLSRAVAANAAKLVSLRFSQTLPSAQQLSRLSAELEIQASYAAVKRVLANVLERYPNATVHRINLKVADKVSGAGGAPLMQPSANAAPLPTPSLGQAAQAPTEVRAQIVLNWWGQPAGVQVTPAPPSNPSSPARGP